MPNERPFEFSEMYIFGKFDTFTKRLKNIISIFETFSVYSTLAESKIEGEMTSHFSESVLCNCNICVLFSMSFFFVSDKLKHNMYTCIITAIMYFLDEEILFLYDNYVIHSRYGD